MTYTYLFERQATLATALLLPCLEAAPAAAETSLP